MDSGASDHMTYDLGYFTQFVEISDYLIIVVDGTVIHIVGVGLIKLNLLVNNKDILIKLTKVYCLPGLNYNFISLDILEQRGLTWSKNNDILEVRDQGEPVMQAIRIDSVYTLSMTPIYVLR